MTNLFIYIYMLCLRVFIIFHRVIKHGFKCSVIEGKNDLCISSYESMLIM